MKSSDVKRENSPFSKYEKMVLNEFRFLIKDYGFRQVSKFIFPPECQIIYQSKAMEVVAFYEWGGVPAILISKLKPTSSGPKAIQQKSLDFFIDSLAEKNKFFWSEASGDMEQKLKAKLHHDAQMLKKYADKILISE